MMPSTLRDPVRGSTTLDAPAPEMEIHLAGAVLREHRHACAFFNSRDENYGVLLPFIKEGFERRERAFHIVDPLEKDDHRERLKAAGIDAAVAEQQGLLETRAWDEAYLCEGHFDQDRMIALIEEILDSGHQQGFPLTRLIAHMEWAVEDRPGVDDLVEYETRLNYALGKFPDPVICTYDLAKFNGQVVVDILRTHPVTIIGGVLQENPFFVPPDAFLEELRHRRRHG